MTTAWTPPRRSYHLRIFAMALALVVLALLGVLFGLHMEALSHGNGVLEADGQEEPRAPRSGIVELGWWQGDVQVNGSTLTVRVDRRGDGCTGPAAPTARTIAGWKIADGPTLARDSLTFHKLQAGDLLWPGQPWAFVVDDLLLEQRDRFEGRLADEKKKDAVTEETAARLQELTRQVQACSLRAPAHDKAAHRSPWLAARLHVEQGQALKMGDAVALLAPCDPVTREPLRFKAVLHIDEKHAAHVAPKQDVRLHSAMFSQRLFGHADGVLERIDPQAEPGPQGGRFFKGHVRITKAPFPLALGASVTAEIVVGKKQIIRVILEH